VKTLSFQQISLSFASEGVGMNELKEWNELYGEGGSRKKTIANLLFISHSYYIFQPEKEISKPIVRLAFASLMNPPSLGAQSIVQDS
jgi:hypothetical protein